MSERRRTIVLGCLCVLLAGCGGGGGSGSTGLVTSEGAVIDQVRRDGTCDEFDGAPYCASDSPNATAPGGQSVSIVTNTPTPVQTPTLTPRGVATASPTLGPASTSTPTSGVVPSATAPPPTPTPSRTSTPKPVRTSPAKPVPTATPNDERTVTAVVDGFEAGAACATAARPAGSEDTWQTASLVAIDDSGAAVTFPVPAAVTAPLDLVLVCFAEAPAALPAELVTLTDADPTVVFVLPSD